MLRHRHVELIVLRGLCAEEAIGHEIDASRPQDLPDRCMKPRGVPLVTELMNRLIRNDRIEQPEALRPILVLEAALYKWSPALPVGQVEPVPGRASAPRNL